MADVKRVVPRDAYATCALAARQAFERADAHQCSFKEYRALVAVVRLTTLWLLLAERATVDQVAELARLDLRDCRRALKRLDELGVIVYRPGGARGRGDVSSVSLPALQSGGATPLHPVVEKEGRSTVKGGAIHPVKEGRSAPPPEKDRELSEDDAGGDVGQLVAGLGFVSSSQRREFVAAHREAPLGFRRCVSQAREASKPIALLTEMVRNGEHRNGAAAGAHERAEQLQRRIREHAQRERTQRQA